MLNIPELVGLDSYTASIRIPPELNVPLTDRVRRIIDTAPFRRLARISQVGLVSLVYPAARHTRFEHSLGVYRLALLILKRLSHIPEFVNRVTQRDAEKLIITALLHDVGHYPFCHLIEDIRLEGPSGDLPHHEELAVNFIGQNELADLLRKDWNIEPNEVIQLLTGKTENPTAVDRLLSSILSGPIDIDKMDYLFRDSLHAGVPYGLQLDQGRLIGSFCLNASEDGLAITEKGKTAAELMIFARYIMFSEVYWHHAVRSATAMLQRLFGELYYARKIDFSHYINLSEDEAVRFLLETSANTPMERLAHGLFGEKRMLYKRVAQYSMMEEPEKYHQFAGKPYRQICELADKLCADENMPPMSILIDAPPVKKEIEFKIDVKMKTSLLQDSPRQPPAYAALEDMSPVVRAMAKEQFDDYVKRVRIFRSMSCPPMS